MTDAEFDEAVGRALDEVPPAIAAALQNLAVVVEDEDPDEPDLYGVYREDPYLPSTIAIYRRPLREAFPDPAELRRQIRITVLHEVAHAFGMDEDRLDELGFG